MTEQRTRQIGVAITVVVVAAIVFVLWRSRSQLPTTDEVRWSSVPYLLIAAGGYVYFQGLLLRDVLAPTGVKLRASEWLGCSTVTMMWNYALPFAGLAFRAVYLSRVHRLALADFVAATSALYLAEFLVFSLLGLVGVWLMMLDGTAPDAAILLLLVAVSAGSLAVTVLRIPMPAFRNRLLRKAADVVTAWYRLRAHPHAFGLVLLWTAVVFGCYAALYLFGAAALGLSLSIGGSAVLSAVTDLALFVRVAPAAAGTYEVSVVYVLREFGMTLAQGLLIALIVRLSQICVLFTAGPWFSALLSRRVLQPVEQSPAERAK